MRYEAFEDHDFPGQWRAEAFDDDGECYVTIFSGPDAEQRARAYIQWVNPHFA